MVRFTERLGKLPVRAVCLVILGVPLLAGAQARVAGSAIVQNGTPSNVAMCAGCHGAKGEGNASAGFPRLAGLSSSYISEQLDNFAGDRRKNQVMGPIAKQLSAPERKAVATYYASLAGPAPAERARNGPLQRANAGAWLAERGRWEQDLPACVQCHGPGAAGVGPAFPPLAGQSSAYIASQLHAFKSGARAGGPLDLMKVVARKLSDTDITAVADYFGTAAMGPTATVQTKEPR